MPPDVMVGGGGGGRGGKYNGGVIGGGGSVLVLTRLLSFDVSIQQRIPLRPAIKVFDISLFFTIPILHLFSWISNRGIDILLAFSTTIPDIVFEKRFGQISNQCGFFCAV